MKKRFVKAISLVTASAMLLSMVSAAGVWKQEREALAANNVILENPTSQRNDEMHAGQKVTWDCVYFGEYPQAEVVSSAAAYTALPDGSYTPKDMVYNATTYAYLEESQNWRDNELTLNGVRYRRVQKRNATYETNVVDGYYQWENDLTYHYFKYAPIKWRVLFTDGEKALLLADTALDNQFYDRSYEKVTWENCSVRSWLNGYTAEQNLYDQNYEGKGFIDFAFDADEAEAILETQLTNEAGETTEDKVFLLSKADISGTEAAESYGFLKDENAIDEARMSYSSTYAKAMGVSFLMLPNHTNGERLRSCGQLLCNDNSEATVNTFCTQPNGVLMPEQNINTGVSSGIRPCYAIRPALCLDLSKVEQYDFAGTVCSDDTAKSAQEVIDGRETLPPASTATHSSVEDLGTSSPSGSPSTKPTRSPSASPSATPTQQPPSGSPGAAETWKPSETEVPQSMETAEPGENTVLKNTVYKGKCFKDEDTEGRYKITKTGENGTVIYLRPLDKTQTNVIIPDEVEYKGGIYRVVAVGEHAFYKNKNLRQITLGDNVTKISNRAFYKCTNLKKINFNKKLKRIGTKAFFRCNSLKKIILPSKVEHIGVRAFYKCKKLQKAVLSKNMRELGTKSFYKCKKLTLDMKKVNKKRIKMGRKPFSGIKQVKYGKVKTRS